MAAREYSVRLVVDAAELTEFKALAEAEGRSVSDVIRRAMKERRLALLFAPVADVVPVRGDVSSTVARRA